MPEAEFKEVKIPSIIWLVQQLNIEVSNFLV